jgi:proteasome lid subunit RPN8/RPN11
MTSTLNPPSSTDLTKPPPPVPAPQVSSEESARKSTSSSTPAVKSSRPRASNQAAPRLVFSTQAWLKLQVLCHAGETEVGAFGISDPQNLLLIQDVVTVKQSCTSVTVRFDDSAVSEFFEQQVEAGRGPQSFGRIWIHTHPGASPDPSGTDEETFNRVFGRCDWAIMFILARGGATYCRLRLNTGPTSAQGSIVALSSLLDVEVDSFTQQQPSSSLLLEAWLDEYRRNVEPEPTIWNDDVAYRPGTRQKDTRSERVDAPAPAGQFETSKWPDDPNYQDTFDAEAWMDCFDELDPYEQEMILVEMAERFDLRGRLLAACDETAFMNSTAGEVASGGGGDSGGGA